MLAQMYTKHLPLPCMAGKESKNQKERLKYHNTWQQYNLTIFKSLHTLVIVRLA
jgi:hypothetical protein